MNRPKLEVADVLRRYGVNILHIMQSIFSSAARLRGSMVGKKPWKPRR